MSWAVFYHGTQWLAGLPQKAAETRSSYERKNQACMVSLQQVNLYLSLARHSSSFGSRQIWLRRCTLLRLRVASLAFRGCTCLRVPRVLRFASDFSGFDSAALALRRLQVPVQHVFCSEINPSCRKLLRHLHRPGIIYADIRVRKEEPACDLYVTTPPCQSWSTAGRKQGLSDPRGSILKHSLLYIKRRRPRLVVMENVRGMAFKKHRPVLKAICQAFADLGYKAHAKILDSQEPQRRRRLFLVAIRKDSLRKAFLWPQPTGECSLEEVLGRDPPTARDKPGLVPANTRMAKLCKDAYSKAWNLHGVDPRVTPVAGHRLQREVGLPRCQQVPRPDSNQRRPRRLLAFEQGEEDEPTGINAGHRSSAQGTRRLRSIPVPMIEAVLSRALQAAGLQAGQDHVLQVQEGRRRLLRPPQDRIKQDRRTKKVRVTSAQTGEIKVQKGTIFPMSIDDHHWGTHGVSAAAAVPAATDWLTSKLTNLEQQKTGPAVAFHGLLSRLCNCHSLASARNISCPDLEHLLE